MTDSTDAGDSPGVTPLLAPADGVPPVLTTDAELRTAAQTLAAGTGPLAVDAERASGFKYFGSAYLIQLRRNGSGSVLIDPIPIGDFAPLAAVINNLEWILHSADQDLPCLAELGLTPGTLYDTELAGRLAGFERVGLAAIVERTLGLGLQKGHGAADWSRRPLPDEWLNYAALDVEVLPQLRDAMAAELAAQGKTDWAAQEFEHVRTAPPPAPKAERWRRTSGIHALRKPRQLAAVREMWTVRDQLGRDQDVAPGRVLPDAAIVAAVKADPATVNDLRGLPVFSGPRQRRRAGQWFAALATARALPASELPTATPENDGPPPVTRWAKRDPEAAQRLTAARAAMTGLSEQVSVPVENLLLPDLLRRVCWNNVTDIGGYLETAGARAWQRELVVPVLTAALSG